MSAHKSTEKPEIVVIGGGVVGLTTALKMLETGNYSVTIIAETLPSDPKTIRYTSHWAGAHHVSLAGDDIRQQKMDKETFDKMWELSAPGSDAEKCFMRLPQTEYYIEAKPRPHELEHMPNFRYLETSELVKPTVYGISFTTLTMDTPVYLLYLLARFQALGGTVIRGSVQHVSQAAEGWARILLGKDPRLPAAVIVCAGIGARFLGGVEDTTVYPVRGQTVLLRAPWITFGRTISSIDGTWTYIIPRRNGDVIVGGIKNADDWWPAPRRETTIDILQRALRLCPELVPPGGTPAPAPGEVTASPKEPVVEDILPLVIEEGCGLRPARKDGIRLEVEWIPIRETRVPIVHNYGHGGYGFQSSWGSARLALDLLEGALDPARGEKAATELNASVARGSVKAGSGSW